MLCTSIYVLSESYLTYKHSNFNHLWPTLPSLCLSIKMWNVVNRGGRDVDCSGGPILLLERVGHSAMNISDGPANMTISHDTQTGQPVICLLQACLTKNKSHLWLKINFWIRRVSTCFHMRGFWISQQKLEISPLAPAMTIFILQPYCWKCGPYQIWIIYISFWSHFWGDSESGHQNLKFTLPHLL
jgi:hypothetical protein